MIICDNIAVRGINNAGACARCRILLSVGGRGLRDIDNNNGFDTFVCHLGKRRIFGILTRLSFDAWGSLGIAVRRILPGDHTAVRRAATALYRTACGRNSGRILAAARQSIHADPCQHGYHKTQHNQHRDRALGHMHLGFFLFLFWRFIFRFNLPKFGIPVFGAVIVSGCSLLCVLFGCAARIFRRSHLILFIFFIKAGVLFLIIYVIASVFVICHMFFSFTVFSDYALILNAICYTNMNFS